MVATVVTNKAWPWFIGSYT